mmetsp:Transcript_21940/g.38561  ORF Transcript_21940/g.38561 Transcript_21940/m.38561 type:complete len:335 (+) Transcript_21940:92-1096(+)
MAAEFRSGTRWQFQCNIRKDWVNCTQDEDTMLKDAYLKCSGEKPTFSYELKNIKIKVDFSKMKRLNLASEREVDLRLSGGSLPFPPPGPAAKKHKSKKAKAALESSAPEPAETFDDSFVPGKEMEAEKEVTDAEKFQFKTNMTGKFEFTLPLEDKEDWALVFLYKMFESGITPQECDLRWLTFTDKKGRVVTTRQRQEFEEMFELARCYPITVKYDPPPEFNQRVSYWGTFQEHKAVWELNNLLLSYIKWSITGPGSVQGLHEIKYRWHKCVYERYQLYAQEDFNKTENVWTEQEFFVKYPELGPVVTLAIKVGPRLRDILRGKEEILNMLFGG